MIDLGQIITNPEPFVQASRAWIEANAMLLAGCAVGALTVAGAAGFGFGAVMDRMRARKRLAAGFGGKRQARAAELLKNPDLKFSGVVLGRIGRKRLTWTGQEPVLVTGGTRSGKGVGVIRPTMLTYGGPVVAYDGGKGELFDDTSGWRGRFSHVINLNFASPVGARFNFLDEIRPDHAVRDTDNLVTQIPSPGGDGHFEAAANRYISACILHVLHGEPDAEKNMRGVVRLIAQGDDGGKRIIARAAHPVAVDRARGLFGCDPLVEDAKDGAKYRQLIYNDALVRLSVFEDPAVADVTGRSDFRLADIFCPGHTGRPVTLYLTTPASEDARLKPVVALFLGMLIDAILADRHLAPDGRKKYPAKLLLVIDEFPSLRLKLIETAMTKILGYGCTFLLGAQSLNALKEMPYGPNNQFRDNIRVHVAFAANDATTQREISQSAGQVPEQRKSVSRRPWGDGGRTETESQYDRPVIDPGAVRCLPDHLELVLVTGHPPILARKLRDYKDRVLKSRMLKPVPMRGADGTYPDLPHPQRPSAWAGVMTASPAPADPPAEEPAPAPSPPKPKAPRKRKLITAPEGDDE
ncbi:type IV secretory system conjugative DNA transfer family protein (plasmid) [Skermanella rosea]|uniref:type IV secretory system conjugative DNA transfer family protein n=1 Tax=Skermanella rosea TaxID=1817965 RepID=UPI001931E30D|nr:type IV secretory system conjugative DNA transfer family protein [Skermanella rosea]UEM08192.1 type IV secretory system conjugative DNA transfer family protein [Skermanella rosea]